MAEIPEKGCLVSSYFQIDYNQTLDLNLTVLGPAIAKVNANASTTTTVTSVTNTTGTTLSAAAIFGRYILRSGPTAGYSDTTDTAANIIALINNPQVGSSFTFNIANQVAFADTLVAGTGVTLVGTTVISASTSREYLLQVTSVGATPTITITGVTSGGI